MGGSYTQHHRYTNSVSMTTLTTQALQMVGVIARDAFHSTGSTPVHPDPGLYIAH